MRNSPSFRVLCAANLAAFLACGGPSTEAEHPGGAGGAGAIKRPELPAIATKVDTVRVAPTDDNSPGARSKLLDVMAAENERSIRLLSKHPREPAYFLAYTVTEERNIVIEAEGGGLISDADETERSLDVDIRVGSPRFDNRHMLANDRLADFMFLARKGRAPFGTNPEALRQQLWLETDRRYRESVLVLRNLKTQERLVAESDKTPDFAPAKKESFVQPKLDLQVDKAGWAERIRKCSRRARKGVATRSGCRLDVSIKTVYYVNSEGTQLQTSWPTSRLSVSVGIKADDGMPLSRTEEEFAPTPDELPNDETVDHMIKTVTKELDALHAAPVVDPYVGPAILEGRAAAVFFHEVFGHRIEGHRQKDPNFGKTFTSEVGNAIVPEWLSVYDDPSIQELNGVKLNGFYRFDDEGVRAQQVKLVDHGVLKGFLLGRTPLDRFPTSNGHGRRAAGLPPVSRQGNLVVTADRSVTEDELRQRLLDEVKRQGKPFGMIFTDISGGFTNTSKFGAQTFKVLPTMAYRLYPDGHTELVRGVDIVGTPLTVLASIIAAARPVKIFNGICGAESGWVPVSASAPSFLLEKVEVERGFQPTNSPPVLNPPSITR